MSDALKLAIKLTRRDMRRASMQLDDALFVELRKIAPDATVLCGRDKALMLAGYRMGLERAAKVAEQHFIYGHAVAGPGFAAKCAAKIRALGDGE
jgi:hypothetical protein